MFLKLCVLLLFLASAAAPKPRSMAVSTVTNLECNFNPDHTHSLICEIKAIKRNTKLVRVGITIKHPLDKLFIQVRHMKKMHSNRYMPGMFDLKINLCDAMSRNSSATALLFKMIDTLSANSETYKKTWQAFTSCPLAGSIYFEDLRDESKKPLQAFFVDPGAYKLHLRFYTSQQNLTLFEIQYFYLLSHY